MSVTTIPRPGVQVIQQFQTVSPTIARPTLPACIVGVCNQVVKAVNDDGTLNSDALIDMPARIFLPFVSTPFQYTALGAKTLGISVNNAATVVITFPASPANPTVDETKAYIDSLAIPGITTEVEVSGTQKRVVIQTVSKGQFASLKVISGNSIPSPLSTIHVGQIFIGWDGYNNYFYLNITKDDYPDPRSNLADLTVDYSTVRAFIDLGGGNFSEVLRTQTFLRGATAAVSTVDDGSGDNLTPFVSIAGQDFTTSQAVAAHIGTVDITALDYSGGGPFNPAKQLIISDTGINYQTIVLDATMTNAAGLLARINAIMGTGFATQGGPGGNKLVLTSLDAHGGEESTIRVDPASTALTTLGIFASTSRAVGAPYKPFVGDELWVDGAKVGNITEVASGGVVTRLRLDTQVLLTFSGTRFFIVAKGLSNAVNSATRPSSDLIVDLATGTIHIKHEQLRDTAGVVIAAANKGVYIAYTALRRDVSPEGSGFSTLRIGSTTDLEASLSPVDTTNPLALGMFFAILNAPGIEVQGVGVSADSTTEPDGTLVAYTEAFTFLESKDVYAIVPLTHDLTVAEVGQVHVDAMSAPEAGLERVLLFNPSRPTRSANTLLSSAPTGNATASSSAFDTGVANLPTLIAAAGLGVGPYTITNNLFLKLEGDTNNYLITAVSGSIVTVSTGALAGNTDGFYFVGGPPAFTAAIVDRAFTVEIRGALLTDLTDEAIAYAAIAQGFKDRRVVMMSPDSVKATINGLESIIDGFYASSAVAGMTSSFNPQDPFTNVGLTGFTGVVGSNDRYGETQLKIMDGGGLWSIVQDAVGQPIYTRHQLTTDMSSVQKREYSITKAVDFVAKFIRSGLRNFIGRFNITSTVMDAINTTLEGLGKFLVAQGVVGGFKINSIQQDPDQPDQLLVNITITVLYPLDIIQVTLVI